MKDACYQLRTATRRAKSDVANKLVSMFLHELSRRISQRWAIRVDGEEYEKLVRTAFCNRCPYCSVDLSTTVPVIEHLDGMNRFRVGLHVPGNVLVAGKRCNSEKRRDDSRRVLSLGSTGWESFLSHNGTRCESSCLSCRYWQGIWPDEKERTTRLVDSLSQIRSFRERFTEFQNVLPSVSQALPEVLTKLYSDCQIFAESEIKSLLERVEASLLNPE
jgi:hypothetical protein